MGPGAPGQMAPGAPGWQPWPAWYHPPVAQVERFLMEGMPGTVIAHSYHVEALRDPALQDNPVFQRFSLIELNELHHMIAAMGAIMRWRQGDPTAAEQLAINLAGFLQNRQAAMEVARTFGPRVTGNPAVQRVLHLVEESNRAIERNLAMLQQVTALAPAGAPGALLVHG